MNHAPRLCRPLASVGASDLALVGGKAANLGELIAAGFPVPDGFVVTTAASRAMSPELRAELSAAYLDLGAGPVAVRSSATAEDLAGATFAGQQDTFLNVVGTDAVIAAVQDCWASLWSERAVAYRARIAVDDADVAIAVVVQRMVEPDWAGVMFTANPVTGARDQVVINSNPGLGEAVVSGAVTPDHAVVGGDASVIERVRGSRTSVIRSVPGGGTRTEHEGADAEELGDDVLVRLAGLGSAVEAHFGRPQDIEWVLQGRELLLTQARPMTALPPPPLGLNHLQRLLGPMLAEMLPRRPLPLELSAWARPVVYGHLAGLIDQVGGAAFDADAMLPTSDGVLQQFVPPTIHPTLRTLVRLPRTLWRSVRRRPQDWVNDPLARRIGAEARALAGLDVRRATWAQLLAVPGRARALGQRMALLRGIYLPAAGRALIALRFLVGALRRRPVGELLVGAPTQTMRANRALAAMAAAVRADPSLTTLFEGLRGDELARAITTAPAASDLQALMTRFTAEFGHRETTSVMMLRDPGWGESPAVVWDLVAALAGAPAPAPQARGAAEVPPAGVVRRLVDTAANGLAMREDSHFELTRCMPAVRRAMLEIGRRLAEKGAIEDADDVWYLTWDQLAGVPDPAGPALIDGRSGSDLRAAIERRKLALAELAGSPLISRASLFPGRRPAGGALVVGLAGGGGRATGAVRVIRDASQFGELRAGEVLVCPATNPSWTPLFQLAAAVVVDNGGPASHAAIVAREYGIPAVLGVADGTAVLIAGERVSVDGDLGAVYPADATS